MGFSRKRPRTQPPVDDPSSSSTPKDTKDTSRDIASTIPLPETPSHESSSDPLGNVPKLPEQPGSSSQKINSKASWYGTWPRKSTPSTKIVKDVILADKATGSASDLARFETPKPLSSPGRPPSMSLGKGKETVDVTMGGTEESEETKSTPISSKTKPGDGLKHGNPEENSNLNSTELPPTVDGMKDTSHKLESKQIIPSEIPSPEKDVPQRPNTSSGWLGGWLPMGKAPVPEVNNKIIPEVESAQKAATSELPDVIESSPSIPVPKETTSTESKIKKPTSVVSPLVPEDDKPDIPQSTSWFGLWSKAAPSVVEKEPQEQIPVMAAPSGKDTVMEDAPNAPVVKPASGSSWAFWTTDSKSSKTDKLSEASLEPVGELAVVGDTTEDSPQPAKAAIVKSSKQTKSKKGKKQPAEVDTVGEAQQAAATTSKTPQKNPQLEAVSKKNTPSPSPAPSVAKIGPPNLLLPSVKSTFRLIENPTILQYLARLILKSRQPAVKHVALAKDTPRIKNALAIGVHGLFPAPLLRTVIGQPTGTSIKFANHASDAIRRWTDSHGLTCEIEKVALEGEGKIGDRVDNLWKLLLNWIDHIRKADFIFIGCHSQGVPVAIMLVAKLLEFGVVSTAKIGICAMAGVSLGPFSDYKSRLFSGSAGELFDFANPESEVSKRYEDSLRVVLKYGTRITYCGSIDDQLVSMESSIFATVNHPYIYRAVFIDGRIHAPDFLSHLVGFALKLRNLGVSDHGLIRELSAPLAGSLYTGEGHSRLYDDGRVYDLAIEFALETSTVEDVPLQTTKYEIPSNANPYVLPWIMRGLLEEEFVKTELHDETTELLKQFDDWKPTTKVLKDVKYRLEVVRSKL